MKTLLLTGVAGFAGAHTLQHILEHTDWKVIGIDSLKHAGKIERIEQVLSKDPSFPHRFELIVKDLAEGIDPLTERIDYIINMASESHVDRSIAQPVPFVKNNLDLTLHMLEFARACKPDVFIQISTDEVYGPMWDDPFKEWATLRPSNPYSASKAAQEMLAFSYWRTYDIPVVITNCMNMIGEMQDCEKYLPKVMKQIKAGEPVTIHGKPEDLGSRFYLHARNHADALLYIMQNLSPAKYDENMPYSVPDKYNITGTQQLDNLEMAMAIADAMDAKDFPYVFVEAKTDRPGHDLHYGLDGTKLERLGWKPPLSFKDSLERTVQWTLEHEDWLL